MIIYNSAGEEILKVRPDDGDRCTKKVMGENTVSLTVKRSSAFDFQVGYYVMFASEKYTLNILPTVKKENATFVYELLFEGLEYELRKVHMLYYTANLVYAGGADFSLMGDAELQARVIVENMNRVQSGWTLGSVITTGAKNLTYSGNNCLEAITRIAEEFGTEYWIGSNKTINIGKRGDVLPINFQYGKNNGLYSIHRTNVSSKDIVTRLYPFGSEQNLPKGYRNNSKRLQIQGSYIEANTLLYGIIESSQTFDEIKPERIGAITTVNVDNVLEFSDSAMNFDLNETDTEGNTLYLIPGTTAKIHFQTGDLAGYEFELTSYNHSTKTFILKKFTDEVAYELPNSTLKPRVGDNYIILDIYMPQSYVDDAEARLLAKAQESLLQNSVPNVAYKVEADPLFIKKLELTYKAGDYVHIEDDDIGIDRDIRIIGIERKLVNTNEYNFELADTVEPTLVSQILTTIERTDVVLQMNRLLDPARARRNYKVVQELQNVIFDQDGYFDNSNIKPFSIETNMLSVGSKGQQFYTNCMFQANYLGNKNNIVVGNGALSHYTIEDEIRSWTIAGLSETLPDDDIRYIFIKCLKAGNTGEVILTANQLPIEDESYYNFFAGVLSSVIDGARQVSLLFGFSTINGRFIKTGRVQSADGSTYFDLDLAEIAGRITFTAGSSGYSNLVDAPDLSVYSLQADVNAIVSNLQAQIDGQIMTWFDSYVPTLSNLPASGWGDAATKDKHLGDLFYNKSTGLGYRFSKTGSVYSWELLKDTDVALALANAAAAQDTADGKRRVFVTTPTPPYDLGDLWSQGATGDLMRCKVAKAEGQSYSAADWEKATMYTDDTVALTALDEISLINATSWDSVFIDTFNETQEQFDSRWANYAGAGERLIVTDSSSGIVGGNVLQLGNNSGDDGVWLIGNKSIPYDPNRLYKVVARIKQTAGIGTMYVGIAGRNYNDTQWVDVYGRNYATSSQHYFAASSASNTDWVTYTGYFKGVASSSNGGVHSNSLLPGTCHTNVKYIRPLIVANYNGQTGITLVDYVLIDYADIDLANVNIAGAAQQANTAIAILDNIGNNNIIAKSEKKGLLKEWNIIVDEVAIYKQYAQTNGVDSTTYETSYMNVGKFLDNNQSWSPPTVPFVLSHADEDTDITSYSYNGSTGGVALKNVFKDYYIQKIALLNTISNITNSAVRDMADDSKLTPSEKITLRAAWDKIVGIHSDLMSYYSTYDIDELEDLEDKFQALANYLNGGTTWSSGYPLWINDANMDVTTSVVRDTFNGKINDFYQAESLARLALNDIAFDYIGLINVSMSEELFSDTFNETVEQLNERWQNVSGTGEISIVVDSSQGVTGGKVMQVGNNSGNDMYWLIGRKSIPYNPNRLYKVVARIKRTAGTGTMYVGIAGRNYDDTQWVNVDGANYSTSSQHYFAASGEANGDWVEYRGYFKGVALSGNGGKHPDPSKPGTCHSNVKYIRPLIVANYSGQTGITLVDYIYISYAEEDLTGLVVANSTNNFNWELLSYDSYPIALLSYAGLATSIYGVTTENAIIELDNPFGSKGKVWEFNCDAADNGNAGGFETVPMSIDPTKNYIFGIWIKAVDSGNVSFYFGPQDEAAHVKNLDGTDPSLKYFINGTLQQHLPVGRWLLAIGVIHHKDYVGVNTDARISGIYDPETMQRIPVRTTSSLYNEYRWYDGNVKDISLRVLRTYAQTASSKMQVYGLFGYQINGSEASIYELLNAASPSINPVKPPDANTFAYYTFDRSTVQDDSYNGKGLTQTGTVTCVASDIRDKCAYFNGSGYLTYDREDAAFKLNTVSVSLWFKFNGQLEGKICSGIFSLNYYHRLYIVTNDIGSYLAYRGVSNGSAVSLYAAIIEVNKWYHVVGELDVTGGKMKLFVNGTLVGYLSGLTLGYHANNVMAIGVDYNNITDYRFNGYIDEFKVFNKILTPEEVMYLYKNPTVGLDYGTLKTIIDGGLVSSGTLQVGQGNDGEYTVKAGMTGVGTDETSVRIWAGATFLNRANAKFQVWQNGHMKATDAEIAGWTIDSNRIYKHDVDVDVELNSATRSLRFLYQSNEKVVISSGTLPLLNSLTSPSSGTVYPGANTSLEINVVSYYIAPTLVTIPASKIELYTLINYIANERTVDLNISAYLVDANGEIKYYLGSLSLTLRYNVTTDYEWHLYADVENGSYRVRYEYNILNVINPAEVDVIIGGSSGSNNYINYTQSKNATFIARDGLTSFWSTTKYFYMSQVASPNFIEARGAMKFISPDSTSVYFGLSGSDIKMYGLTTRTTETVYRVFVDSNGKLYKRSASGE